MRDDWRRFAAPAAFLAAATLAVVLIRDGVEAGADSASGTTTLPTLPRKHVAVTTTAKKHSKTTPSSEKFWTVQPGDTFGVISTKSGVPVATIEQLNPNVSSTTLTIGEKIRLR